MNDTEPPSDIDLAVFKHVGDLAVLRNLIKASSTANFIFHEAPVEVFNHVVGQAPKELQQVIHAVAISNSPNTDAQLIENGILYNKETSYNTTTEVEDSLPPIDFDLPVAVLKQILEIAHRIQLLATLFLKTSLRRLNDLTPQHLAKPDFVFSSYPFRKYPSGKDYKPTKTGPPSWVEEYRVLRAFWRLQFFCLLSKPKVRVTARINEQAADVECNVPHRQQEFSQLLARLTTWEIDEIISVQEYLEFTRISLRAPPSTFHEKDTSSSSTSNPSSSANGMHPPSSPSTPSSTSTTPSTFPNLSSTRSNKLPSPFQRHHDLIAVKHSTEAYNFFHRYGLLQTTSPLQRSHWANFRRLGFGIWDQERMCQMELFRMPAAIRDQAGVRDLSIDNVAFTWKSVEAAGEAEGKVDDAVDDLSGNLDGLGMNGAKKEVLKKKERKEEKGLTGLKGLMRGKARGAKNSNASDTSSPRTSFEDIKFGVR